MSLRLAVTTEEKYERKYKNKREGAFKTLH